MEEDQIAKMIYKRIEKADFINTYMQGASGLIGNGVPAIVDCVAITHIYTPLANDIRRFYQRTPLTMTDVTTIIKGCGQEIISDILLDKIAGNIPVVGIVFNAVCAKSMTWRLGLMFAMLSAYGEMVDKQNVSKAIHLIRLQYPQSKSLTFNKPSFFDVSMLLATMHSSTDFIQSADQLIEILLKAAT